MYGMANTQEMCKILEVVEIRGTCESTKTVSELILELEYKTRNRLKPSPFTKVHQEGIMVFLEGAKAHAIDGAAIDLCAKFKEWSEIEVFFGKTKEVRRSPVEMVGEDIDHYQGMTHEKEDQTHTTEYI